MTYRSKVALAIGLVAIAMPASAQRLGQDRPKDAKPQEQEMNDAVAGVSATTTTGRKLTTSKEAQKAIVELQKAVDAKDAATIPAKLAAALKVASTGDDRYIIGSNQARAALAANDTAGLKAGLTLMADSGVGEPDKMSMNFADLGRRLIKEKKDAEASPVLDKAIAIDANNASALALAADIKSRTGDKAGAVALMQKSFAASAAKGQKVLETNYRFATGMAYEAKSPAATAVSRTWAQNYPGPDSWRAAVQIYRAMNQPRGQQLLDMWRLARLNKAIKGEADYDSYLGSLVNAGLLGEAKAVLAEAATQPNIDMTKTQFATVKAKVAAAPARAAIDAKAKAATTGAAMIAAGDHYYGIGAYSEAAALYRAALTKGGDAGVANLHLGMALAASGDKAGAATALKAVTGANAEIAKYWLIQVGA